MKTDYGHLSYCSNIHPGEDWKEHFFTLQQSIPAIKAQVCPNQAMGVGLRLANQASIDLLAGDNLQIFKKWLAENQLYVFTMNGFPYGNFHEVVVKDMVHAPDWTSYDRAAYTIRMFDLLANLLPESIDEGGISTSPLSYRFWWKGEGVLESAIKISTQNIISVIEHLIDLRNKTGKILHLDIEPEPDGILENSDEFIDWYQNYLLPMGIEKLEKKGLNTQAAKEAIRIHLQLCYDVCHFAVGFEEPAKVIEKLEQAQIKVGKIQISSALKIDFSHQAEEKLALIQQYNEPTYLHQVVAEKIGGSFVKYPDLGQAIQNFNSDIKSWRIHFHVPLFLETYGLLDSTQNDISKTLAVQKSKHFTNHLEIETYTWGVLPKEFQINLNDSISREIEWVKNQINSF